ncbi:MAG: DUF2325 domain-containing protein [Deltaproteobacteria bacterium]|nr:DUF2325 domain-containing protein [Deltaproteobacteria bacterium]
MRIGWVGGLERSDSTFEQLAVAAGHKLEFHNGDVRGNGLNAMRGLVNRSSVVVILTTINSHQGVQLAKRLARKQNRPFVVMKRCGRSGFRQFLSNIDRHEGNDT